MPTKAILHSVEQVFIHCDITKLTKAAYDCLYLMSGFIAHYNLGGFQDEYQDLRHLISDILSSSDVADSGRYIRDPFFRDSYGMEYCQSKTDTYEALGKLAEQYKNKIEMHFTFKQSSEEIELAEVLAEKNGFKLVKNNGKT